MSGVKFGVAWRLASLKWARHKHKGLPHCAEALGIKIAARRLEANEGGREEEENGLEISPLSLGRSCGCNWL